MTEKVKNEHEHKKQEEETVAQENTNTTPESHEELTEDTKETGVECDEESKSENKKAKKDKHKKALEELAVKINEITDKHLRLQAEFDNFRKRTLKEKADLIKSGGENVLVNILPIVDDFERAIESLKETADDDIGKQGTLLIYSKFRDFLKQNNVKEIDAMNQPFDVDHHEAITKIPAPTEELKGKVVDVIQKGYQLNEKVIRFAKVVIGE